MSKTIKIPRPAEVSLEPYEMELAAMVGLRRHHEALKAGKADRFDFKGDGLSIHVEGAMGEMAFAKLAGVFWNGSVNTFQEGGDVGKIEVRTRSKHSYDLIVRDGDKPDSIYILMTGSQGAYRAQGWIRGKKAMMEHWMETHGNRPPAYFVPARNLRDVRDLIKYLAMKNYEREVKTP